MKQININNYADIIKLDKKIGTMSKDQTKLVFDNLYISTSDLFDDEATEETTNNPKDLKSEFLKEFPPLAPITAFVSNHHMDSVTYWLLAASTPIPEDKLDKNSEVLNYVTVINCGRI